MTNCRMGEDTERGVYCTQFETACVGEVYCTQFETACVGEFYENAQQNIHNGRRNKKCCVRKHWDS